MKKPKSHFVGWEVELLLIGDDTSWRCKIVNSLVEDGVMFYLCQMEKGDIYINSKDVCWVKRLKRLDGKPEAKIFRFTRNQHSLRVVK